MSEVTPAKVEANVVIHPQSTAEPKRAVSGRDSFTAAWIAETKLNPSRLAPILLVRPWERALGAGKVHPKSLDPQDNGTWWAGWSRDAYLIFAAVSLGIVIALIALQK